MVEKTDVAKRFSDSGIERGVMTVEKARNLFDIGETSTIEIGPHEVVAERKEDMILVLVNDSDPTAYAASENEAVSHIEADCVSVIESVDDGSGSVTVRIPTICQDDLSEGLDEAVWNLPDVNIERETI